VYSGSASFVPGAGTRFLTPITLTTTSTSSFAFLPTTFSITSGMNKFDFKFAPKSTTKAGLGWLEFTPDGTGASAFAPLRPLPVAVLSDKCQITNDGSYSFPVGGTSLPYVLDFSNCIPESDISIKLYAYNSSSTAITDVGKGFDSKNFTVDGEVSKSYSVKVGGVPAVTFTLQSTDATVTVASGIGKLLFVWDASTNLNSYSI